MSNCPCDYCEYCYSRRIDEQPCEDCSDYNKSGFNWPGFISMPIAPGEVIFDE